MADKFFIRVFQPLAAVSTDAVLQFARTKNGVATRTLLADLDDAGLFRATSFGIYGGSNGTDFSSAMPGLITVSKGLVTAVSAFTGFVDTTAIIVGSSDATKKLRFEVDGFTTATTRVLTPLNKDYTIEETGHQAKHNAGGGDTIVLDTLGAPTDITTLNSSTSAHGLLPKLDGSAAKYLDGSGAWSTPGGGTSGMSWTKTIDESGASLSNWTQTSGSWSVVSSEFQVSTAANASATLTYTANIAQSAVIFECDVKMFSTGGFGSDNRVGIRIAYDGGAATQTGHIMQLRCTGTLNPASTGRIYTEQPSNNTAGPTITYLFAIDTYITIRLVAIGNLIDLYVNGVYQLTTLRNETAGNLANSYSKVGVQAFNCKMGVKNVKMWTPSLP